MILIIFEALFFPILIVVGILAVKRTRALHDRRIDEYRPANQSSRAPNRPTSPCRIATLTGQESGA